MALKHSADGVFDHKAYTEKGLAKMVKAKAKAERTAMRLASQVAPTARMTADAQDTPASDDVPEATLPDTQPDNDETAAAPAVDRIELLRSKVNIVARFMQLVVPILIDVYTASVISTVRVKSLTALLKAISFLDSEGLQLVLNVRVHPH
jgi:E3 ubiquitin-protein ligase TRIP12